MEQAFRALRSEFERSARDITFLETKLNQEFLKQHQLPAGVTRRGAQQNEDVTPFTLLQRLDRLEKEVDTLRNDSKSVAEAKKKLAENMKTKLAASAELLENLPACIEGDGSGEHFDRLASRFVSAST
ncbi:hypothetical protein HK104_003775 [Borealophlyctis nickersoniae]|nr:hypothetical protein HK104_003775 [Borealophlyctis nickersoniae]